MWWCDTNSKFLWGKQRTIFFFLIGICQLVLPVLPTRLGRKKRKKIITFICDAFGWDFIKFLEVDHTNKIESTQLLSNHGPLHHPALIPTKIFWLGRRHLCHQGSNEFRALFQQSVALRANYNFWDVALTETTLQADLKRKLLKCYLRHLKSPRNLQARKSPGAALKDSTNIISAHIHALHTCYAVKEWQEGKGHTLLSPATLQSCRSTIFLAC